MTCTFVSIQGTYNKLELALFYDATCIQVISKSDIKASSHLIPLFDSLLQKNNLSLNDLSFIAVDKGPGAFTSLRVTVATVNGLAFARRLPLIGVNSLEALARQVQATLQPGVADRAMIVCLLNAYNNDVYYLLVPPTGTTWIGCKKIDDVLADLAVKAKDYQLLLAGNGVELHRTLITQVLGGAAREVDPFVSVCSAEVIGRMAYEQWKTGQGMVDQVAPLYLKTQTFAVKK